MRDVRQRRKLTTLAVVLLSTAESPGQYRIDTPSFRYIRYKFRYISVEPYKTKPSLPSLSTPSRLHGPRYSLEVGILV